MRTSQRDIQGFNFDEEAGMVKVRLPEAFSYDETLIYLTRSSQESLHHVEDRKIYKLMEQEERLSLIEISEDREPGILQIRFVDDSSRSQTELAAAVDYIREWFDLDTDLAPFYQLMQEDPLLSGIASEYYGLRIIGVPDLFEALCWAVIGQQINLTFAYTLKKRFVQTYGRSVEWRGRSYWAFPKPRDIAVLLSSDLMKLQLTGKKSEYIIGIAELMESGALSKDALLALGDFKAAERQLVAIRGIGPWTANYVLMRCLRDPAAFPVADVGLHNALKQLQERPGKPPESEIRELFAAWSGYEAYVVFYLWRSIADVTG